MATNKPSTFTLTPGQTLAVNQARRLLVDSVADLDNAEKCGIDCQQYRDEHKRILDGLNKVIEHFGHKGT